MRFRAPANVLLHRAQIILILAGLVPTILMSALAIVLITIDSGSLKIVIGVLVLTLCTSAVTGYILGSIFLTKGATVARVQNDYLSTVSHELNTPLTSIQLFIETLRDPSKLEVAEHQKCLGLLSQEMERLNVLVSRLYDLSRIEAGVHEFDWRAIRVEDLLEDALSTFDAVTLKDPVSVEVDVGPDLWVMGDPVALSRAFANLLTNAWKYTSPSDRKIEIAARDYSERFVEVTVADNGVGIPRGEQKRIFDKFERGDQAIKEGKRGSGLGLAIVRAIVRANRGKIDVKSSPHSGSEFRIRLRRRPA